MMMRVFGDDGTWLAIKSCRLALLFCSSDFLDCVGSSETLPL